MLECVINISEGQNEAILADLASSLDASLLDLHRDALHHRSVFTLASPDVEQAARSLATSAVAQLDIGSHDGIHPRLGVVDVVPFVPLGPAGMSPAGDLVEAIAARNGFARWAADELRLPCFCYGPERSLPEVRRRAFVDLAPDFGPGEPHPTAGACCVGARRMLVAYNLVLDSDDIGLARSVVAAVRSSELRALAFAIGREVEVSCNLIAPWSLGPADAYDAVAALAPIRRAELVGLLPDQVLRAISPARWPTLGLDADSTIESRLMGLEDSQSV